jgi:putative toxin-antitoxin system antitoxin component (TIGR02293 family)
VAHQEVIVAKVREAGPKASDLEDYQKKIRRGRPGVYYYVKLLGLETEDPLELVIQSKRGLSYGALERFQKNTALSTKDLSQVVQIRVRTLIRRKEQGRLQPDESDRLLRASRIFGRALELFEGDVAGARRWLSTPQSALGGSPPIVVLTTDVGAMEVENLIGRLEYGIPT